MRRRGVGAAGRRVLAALAAALLAGACGGKAGEAAKEVGRATTEPLRSLPGRRQAAQVTAFAERGRFVEARLRTQDFDIPFLFPDGETCREVLEPGSEVEYGFTGPLGLVYDAEDEDDRCEPIGVLSLSKWRDRKPRPAVPPLPRAQATFDPIYSDEEYVFVRGRFPLATLVDFHGADDLIAVVPHVPACEGPLEEGVASMEYLASGRIAYRLVSAGETCAIRGFAIPPDREDSES